MILPAAPATHREDAAGSACDLPLVPGVLWMPRLQAGREGSMEVRYLITPKYYSCKNGIRISVYAEKLNRCCQHKQRISQNAGHERNLH